MSAACVYYNIGSRHREIKRANIYCSSIIDSHIVIINKQNEKKNSTTITFACLCVFHCHNHLSCVCCSLKKKTYQKVVRRGGALFHNLFHIIHIIIIIFKLCRFFRIFFFIVVFKLLFVATLHKVLQ